MRHIHRSRAKLRLLTILLAPTCLGCSVDAKTEIVGKWISNTTYVVGNGRSYEEEIQFEFHDDGSLTLNGASTIRDTYDVDLIYLTCKYVESGTWEADRNQVCWEIHHFETTEFNPILLDITQEEFDEIQVDGPRCHSVIRADGETILLESNKSGERWEMLRADVSSE